MVGLNVDRQIYGLVEYADKENSNEDAQKNFFTSVSKSINSDDFDNKDFYEQVKFFLKLIRDDKLIIRKTIKPNHAKLYIFKLKEDQAKDCIFITGSSNLTKAGLRTQDEFNVEISDHGTEDAESFFDALWDIAIKITEEAVLKTRLLELLEYKTLIAEVTPFEAFVLTLKSYLETQEQKEVKQSILDLLEKSGYRSYKYQLDAVRQALSIIQAYNGVIISDVVGLGKSIIASMVAKSIGRRGIVLCSPGLIGDENGKSGWKKYLKEFKLYDWEVRSIGKLDKMLDYVKESDDIEVIIVDEAHKFRNQDTEDYELLSNICKNKIVILLTATPFNNAPSDIFSLLKLFIAPGKSKITLDNRLDIKFATYNSEFKKLSFIKKNHNSPDGKKEKMALNFYEKLFGTKNIDLGKIKERAKYLSIRIRSVIEPIVIRRNRIDLKKDPEYSKEIYELPEVKDPDEMFFELTQKQSEFYDRVINEYFGEEGRFSGAIYQPYNYEIAKKIDEIEEEEIGQEINRELLIQKNLFDFMRRLLVKRFESSFGAFYQSINNFKKIHEIVSEFIENSGGKYILDRKLVEKAYELDGDDIAEQLDKFAKRLEENPSPNPKTDKIYDINSDSFKLKDRFLSDIRADIDLFDSILNQLDELKLVKNDPKLTKLIHEIENIIQKNKKHEPQRKVVIFTEYIDTVKYLEPEIEKNFRGRLLTIKGDLTQRKLNQILENFDAAHEIQQDDISILLSTDKISEGFNLNRAGAIINYDIPWNPTRVIQRVGRINRISKKVFDELYIYNFFPTLPGSNIVRSRQIASDKMFLIHNTLGEDVKIFEPDEEPSPSKLFNKIMVNPEELEEESFQTKIRQEYYQVKGKYPELIGKIESLPPRIKVAKKFSQDGLFIFIRKGLGFFTRCMHEDSKSFDEPDFEEVYDLIKCKADERPLNLSEKFWGRYQKIKEIKERTDILGGDQSLESKARNNLQFMQSLPYLESYYPFIKTLYEDVIEYKTLPDSTLRKIVNLKTGSKDKADNKKVIQELEEIRSKLGDDYLEKIKSRIGELSSEVIIAIENRKA